MSETNASITADGEPPEGMSTALQWVLESGGSPATTLTTWLVQEIDPTAQSALSVLASPNTALSTLKACKDAFKHLTIDGETADDRAIGAVYYAASIAAGLAHHRMRISRQSDHALEHAFRGIWSDESAELALRDLAWRGFMTLRMGLDAPDPR